MSTKSGKLSSLLIKEHFGLVVQQVHNELVWGPKTVSILVSSTGLPAPLVKKALSIMIQYDFVGFEVGKSPNIAEYKLFSEKILLLLRYPRYLALISEKFGDASRLIMDEILRNGCTTATKCILSAYKRIDELSESFKDGLGGLRDRLGVLISEHYLTRATNPTSPEEKVPILVVNDKESNVVPDLSLAMLNKLAMGEIIPHQDAKLLWRVNFDRLHQDMRDEVMIEALSRRVDPRAGSLLGYLLRLVYLRTSPWVSQSNPVPYLELRDALDKNPANAFTVQYMEQYFKVIEEDSCSFVRRFGESSSASVFVNFATAIKNLTSCAIENLVEQRFGPKAARIFRLVKCKKYMDQEQIQKLAMIPDKESKQLTYRLLQENFLQMMELKKSTGGGLNKNFYVFHVDINQVVRVVSEICNKAIYNTLTRAEHEKKTNSRLIEKQQKLNSIAECMRAQGTEDQQIQELIDEWITPPEKELLDSIHSMIERLQLSNLYVDETMFILQLYIYYQHNVKDNVKS